MTGVRRRRRRALRVLGLGVAFAVVFAPGESLAQRPGAGFEATSTAAAVLAPTFVSTPMARPDEPVAFEARSDHDDRGAPSLVPRGVPVAAAIVAALALARRALPFARPRSLPRRGSLSRANRAPPRHAVSAFA